MKKFHTLSSDEKLKLFGQGEWVKEPDLVEFEYEGIRCRIRRHPYYGNLCGYILLPANHIWCGKKYYDLDVDVHGGLSYGEYGEDGFWIGFDCGHVLMDYIPAYKIMDIYRMISIKSTYKNIDFVIDACKYMAEQANEAQKTGMIINDK
jgi:hypothetical protein